MEYEEYDYKNYIIMRKFNFSFNEVNNSFDIKFENLLKVSDENVLQKQNILSCFQTEKNIIECSVILSNKDLYVFILNEFLEIKVDYPFPIN